MKIIFRRGRLLILQDKWRIDWRTPNWLPFGVIFTLKRWIE